MSLFVIVLSSVGLFLLSWFLTLQTRRYLMKKSIMDLPNERSSHSVPTPRGGGLAVTGLMLLCWIIYATTQASLLVLIPIIAGGALALLSWADDLLDLSAARRLLIQLLATFAGFYWISQAGSISQGILPVWAEWIFFSLFWTGFLNFYNFMDGIDGISGVETIAIGLGLFLVTGFVFDIENPYLIGLAIAIISLGFLMVNWHPAKIFLGDVGSIPLGYFLGGLLLYLAAEGYWASALILPAYYLSDAGITLLRRLLRGEKIWLAHREHYYQQATQKGLSHAQVSRAIAICNISLIALAYYALTAPLIALALASLSVAILLFWMKKK